MGREKQEEGGVSLATRGYQVKEEERTDARLGTRPCSVWIREWRGRSGPNTRDFKYEAEELGLYPESTGEGFEEELRDQLGRESVPGAGWSGMEGRSWGRELEKDQRKGRKLGREGWRQWIEERITEGELTVTDLTQQVQEKEEAKRL